MPPSVFSAVEEAAARTHGLGRRQRVAERRQRSAEEERRRHDRERDQSHPRGHASRAEQALGGVRGGGGEDRAGPQGRRRGRQLEDAVSPDRPRRGFAGEETAEGEPCEVARQNRRRRRRSRPDDERRRAQPQELQPERRGAGEREAEPEKRRHDFKSQFAAPTTASTRLATATSAGPSGRSKR